MIDLRTCRSWCKLQQSQTASCVTRKSRYFEDVVAQQVRSVVLSDSFLLGTVSRISRQNC